MSKSSKIIFTGLLVALLLAGCATLPTEETVPSYTIDGAAYYPLARLCAVKGIAWNYDTYGRTVRLSKDGHTINFMVGDSSMLVDGQLKDMAHPAKFYDGLLVVPFRLKEQVDILFKVYIGVPQKPAVSRIKRIVIDAGHGGHDPGAIGKTGLREKVVNLDIAQRVSDILRRQGLSVTMTRSSDRFITLFDRANLANRGQADIFLSIHSNANRSRSLSGFEAYYVSSDVSDLKRAVLAARSTPLNLKNASFSGQSYNLKVILWDMIFASNRAESAQLSQAVCYSMKRKLDAPFLGIKCARYQVLREARTPAVLVEVGFVSNAAEEARLRTDSYRQRIAEAIAEGVMNYGTYAQLAHGAN